MIDAVGKFFRAIPGPETLFLLYCSPTANKKHMQAPTEAGKDLFNLKVIYFALLAGVLLFATVVIISVAEDIGKTVPGDKTLLIALLIVTATSIPAGMYLSRRKISQIPKDISLSEKMRQLTAAWIIRLATIEATLLFSLVILLVTADYRLLYITVLILFYFAMNYPSKEKAAAFMNLSREEFDQL